MKHQKTAPINSIRSKNFANFLRSAKAFPLKRSIIAATFFVVLIAVSALMAKYSNTNAKAIKYVVDEKGWEVLCWEGNCAWSNRTSPEQIERYGSTPPTLVTHDVEAVKQSKTILKYSEIQGQYSPLKSFVINKDKIVFNFLSKYQQSKNHFGKSLIYVYNKSTAKLSSFVVPSEDFYVNDVAEDGNITLLKVLPDLQEVEFYQLDKMGKIQLVTTAKKQSRIKPSSREGWQVFDGYVFKLELPKSWVYDGHYFYRDNGTKYSFTYLRKESINAEYLTPGQTTSQNSVTIVLYQGSFGGKDLFVVENFQKRGEESPAQPLFSHYDDYSNDDYPTTAYLVSGDDALIIDGLGREVDSTETEILNSLEFVARD